MLRPATNRAFEAQAILEKVRAAVERHTPDDVRVGLALSGGIDSGTIAGILAHRSQRLARNVHAFSVNPPNTTNESSLIDATIRRTGLLHTYVPVDGLDYPRALAHLVDIHDEPIQYSGVLYQFILRQRMAEAGCKAVLVGYGADEIFSGYRFLALPFLRALVSAGRVKDCFRFVAGARDFLDLPSPGKALREVFARRRPSPLMVVPPRVDTGPRSVPIDFRLAGVDQGQSFVRALLRCFRTNIPLLVRLEDRNAMAHGLDLCVPFMDDELIQTAFTIPFHLYMTDGQNKAVLRQAARDVLAPEVSAYPRKLFTPGNDAYMAFDVLGQEFRDLLRSTAFYRSELWSRRCPELYAKDSALGIRGHIWFRIYVIHTWYERVVRSAGP